MAEPRFPARLLWDQGGLWSLMMIEACAGQGLALEPISADEVAAGGLAGARLLVVPGGWPALKRQALGAAGRAEVRRFVRQGGLYFGVCGGAGLALDVQDGLGLLELTRERGGGRLPALSGPILVEPGPEAEGHVFWRGIEAPAELHVWWPGQFAAGGPEVRVIAVYDGPLPGLFTSDLCAFDITGPQWPDLEASYGIRLRPEHIAGQAAVLEAPCGQGRALLSYLHLDTPGDAAGARILGNLWAGWLGGQARRGVPALLQAGVPASGLGRELAARADEMWSLGQELGLWRDRHPAMPLWPRGVRGLEMWSLRQLCRACAAWSQACPRAAQALPALEPVLAPIWEQAPAVLGAQAQTLLGGEAYAPGQESQARWFPQPRRVGGELAVALAALEGVLLRLWRLGAD